MTIADLLKYITDNKVPHDTIITHSDAEGNNIEAVHEACYYDDPEEYEHMGDDGFKAPVFHFWGN